jgi:hypothetical protein
MPREYGDFPPQSKLPTVIFYRGGERGKENGKPQAGNRKWET